MNLADLPPPPAGKIGWPWTEDSGPVERESASTQPRISIVTPSFNQGAFLEETIRSVLLQNYPNLEYIVYDGRSSDGSVEIIRKYEEHLAYWVSAKDAGQSDALNKAFRRASGKWVGWINSDDHYLPGALQVLIKAVSKDENIKWVAGSVKFLHESDPNLDDLRPQGDNRRLIDWLLGGSHFHQPGTLWKRSLLDRAGLLRDDMQFAFDWEFWCRLAAADLRPKIVDQPVAVFRMHDESKTCTQWDRFCAENEAILKTYISRFAGAERRALETRRTSLVCSRIRHESDRLLPVGQNRELFRRVMEAARDRPRILLKKTPYELLFYSAISAAANLFRKNGPA